MQMVQTCFNFSHKVVVGCSRVMSLSMLRVGLWGVAFALLRAAASLRSADRLL
jgi:hypothetical protein